MNIEMTTKNDCLIRNFRVGQFFRLLNDLPGRKRWIDRELVFQPTGANIAYIMEYLPDAIWDEGSTKLKDDYLKLKMEEENFRQDKLNNLVDESGYEFRTKPYDHQRQAFLLSRDKKTFALFHEQGTGKTKVLIDTAAYRYEHGLIDTVIVIAKNGAHINWVINEIPVHLPTRIPHLATYYTNSWSKAEYNHMFNAAKEAKGMLRFLTFHVEGMNAPKAQALFKEWINHSKAWIVIDESSRIKNHYAKRTKFIIKTSKHADFRTIATGTPLTSGIENLYTQFLFLDDRILGYTSFYTFRAHFCIMGGFEGREIIRYKNIQELINIIDGHSHRVLEKDCLDLPPKIYRRHLFELSPEHRRLYDAIRKNAIAELQSILGEERGLKRAREISVVRALRLQQVACGLTPEKNPTRLDGDNRRMNALMEELEEAQEHNTKVIVWARFKADLRDIQQLLGPVKAVSYHGDTKEKERILSLQRFQTDDKTRFLVASNACAYSHTLTASNESIYHSQTSSLDIRLQSEKRNHRIGTTGDHVLYVDLEAIRTVDRKIIHALRKHKSLADQINRDPISLFMEEEDADE